MNKLEYAVKVQTIVKPVNKIGVISDTHIPARAAYLPPAVFHEFRDADLILHAGDLVEEKVMVELTALAPVEAIAGNMDPHQLQSSLGKVKLIKVGELQIGLLHGDLVGRRFTFGELDKLFAPFMPQVVVFGHLHEPLNRIHKGRLYFNPGSATDPRHVKQPSIGRLIINGQSVKGEIIYI